MIPSVRLDEKIGGTKSLENVLYLINNSYARFISGVHISCH